MIQAISTGRHVNFSSTPAIQSKNMSINVQQQNATSPYSKDYADASRSLAFASINMNKAEQVQNVSFHGTKMRQLPEGWIFDLENVRIRDNYGVEEQELTADQKKELSEESLVDFKLFTANKAIKIPFYKYTPICNTSTWMPDGYLDVRKNGDLEFVCWEEIKEEFPDD